MFDVYEYNNFNLFYSAHLSKEFWISNILIFIILHHPDLTYDQAEELAIELDAQEVIEFESDEGKCFEFQTEPTHFLRVQDALTERGFKVISAKVKYEPKQTIVLKPEGKEALDKMVEKLIRDCDTVTDVHHNVVEKRRWYREILECIQF